MRWTNPERLGAFLAALALLGGCSPEPESRQSAEVDPAMAKALADPLMTDPDLTDRNLAPNAIDIAPPDGSLPTHELGPKALEDARAAALIDLGGPGKMLPAPAPSPDGAFDPPDPRRNPACSGKIEYTMQWAARMPRAFPVYPHGATQQAEGSNAPGCAFRAITFITPVPGDEVVDYYYSRAIAAGFTAGRTAAEGTDTLAGAKGAAAYAVRVSETGGATAVELLTSGF